MSVAELPVNYFALMITGLVIVAITTDIGSDLALIVRGRNVVLLGMISWFLLEAVQVPTALGAYSQHEYDIGVLYVGIAFLAFLCGYGSPGCPIFLKCAKQVQMLDNPRYMWQMITICSFIGFAPIVYYSGLQITELFTGILGMRKTWGGLIGRGRYGGLRDALLTLEMFVTGIGPFAALVAMNRNASSIRRIIATFIAFWPVLRSYGSGTRSSLLTSVLPVLAIFYWKAPAHVKRFLVLLGLLSTPLMYFASAAMVSSRDSGEFDWEAANKGDYNGHEMFRELLFIVRNFPSAMEYQLGSTYYAQVVNPIPRFLWKEKPSNDAGILLAKMYGYIDANGEAFMTNSPGLIGEMYLNFGLIGIGVLSLFGGWLVKGWDLIPAAFEQSLPVMIFYSAGLAVLVVLGRSFNMPMLYGLIVIMLGVTFLPYLGLKR